MRSPYDTLQHLNLRNRARRIRLQGFQHLLISFPKTLHKRITNGKVQNRINEQSSVPPFLDSVSCGNPLEMFYFHSQATLPTHCSQGVHYPPYHSTYSNLSSFRIPSRTMAGIAPIESFWHLVVSTFTEKQLKTVGTFVVHEGVYWLSYIPFFVADFIPFFSRYKIQPDKKNTRPLQSNCFRRVIFNHFLLVLPIILLTHPIFDMMGCKYTVDTIPPIQTIILQLVLFFLIEDFVFYWGHRALHTPWLYKNVHSLHHEHAAPFGITAEYAHPFEVMFLGAATLAGPILVGPHLLTLQTYLTLRCMQTVECHSGYDFPWSLNRWMPLYGGADFHDHHHRIYSGNYSSTFIWVDKLFRTDTAYQIWKAKQQINMPPKSHFS